MAFRYGHRHLDRKAARAPGRPTVEINSKRVASFPTAEIEILGGAPAASAGALALDLHDHVDRGIARAAQLQLTDGQIEIEDLACFQAKLLFEGANRRGVGVGGGRSGRR